MNEWKPIETAPMDGTVVLATNGKTIAQIFWHKCDAYSWQGVQVDEKEYWDLVETGGLEGRCFYEPLYWMPMIKLPLASSQE